eukprot:scaffold162_cov267-Chaetoceros_neogracile.AAC.62
MNGSEITIGSQKIEHRGHLRTLISSMNLKLASKSSSAERYFRLTDHDSKHRCSCFCLRALHSSEFCRGLEFQDIPPFSKAHERPPHNLTLLLTISSPCHFASNLWGLNGPVVRFNLAHVQIRSPELLLRDQFMSDKVHDKSV